MRLRIGPLRNRGWRRVWGACANTAYAWRGTLGDTDPVQAIADALYQFPAEEIVICLEAPERPHWLRKGVVERTRERFGIHVTEIDVAARKPAAIA